MSRWGWVMLVLASTASAQEVAIYRCTDAQGALTVQNMPCPKGVQQQKKLMTAPAAMPLPSSAAAPVSARPAPARAATQAPPVAAPAPQAPAAVPTATTATSSLPPPPLFECTAHDNGRYF
ncbi:DUF4124 domain-containing protein, partial [Xanthomonas campestris pv. campestris]